MKGNCVNGKHADMKGEETMKDGQRRRRVKPKRKAGDRMTKDERRDKEIVDTAKKALDSDRNVISKHYYNDPVWYTGGSQLGQDAFNISMSNRLGHTVNVFTPNNATTTPPYGTTASFVIPGIMSLDIVPVPGISRNSYSALNVASRQIYSYVRHANSGATNYQAADLMLYLLANANAYALLNWYVRLYGVLNTYSTFNAYMPRALVQAMNVDFDDLILHISDFRAFINQCVGKINVNKVPFNIPLISRYKELFNTVFSDSDSPKAQLYMYNPSIIYKWVEQTATGDPGLLTPVGVTTQASPLKFDGLQALMNGLLDPIFYSEDFGIMSGDILKAYGPENCHVCDEVKEDFAIYPEYNPEIQMQVENAHIQAASFTYDGTWNITQNANEELIFQPTVNVARSEFGSTYMFNFHKAIVTPDDVAVATRMNFIPNLKSAKFTDAGFYGTATLESCGTEIVARCRLLTINYSTNPASLNAVDLRSYMFMNQDQSHNSNVAQAICAASQFDWNPIVEVVYEPTNDTTPGRFLGFLADLDNYVTIADETLVKMNDIALLYEYGVTR